LISCSEEEEQLMIWRRFEQACRRDATKQQRDTPWGNDGTPAELVRVLLRCLKAGRSRPPQELIASILCHSNSSIVLGTLPQHTPTRTHTHTHTHALFKRLTPYTRTTHKRSSTTSSMESIAADVNC
jgi:hypothetical protein